MKLAICLIAASIIVLFVGCDIQVVKPTYLYEDGTLYKRIQKRKVEMTSKNPVEIQAIREQLNDYDTYTNKAHKTIESNNRLALKGVK